MHSEEHEAHFNALQRKLGVLKPKFRHLSLMDKLSLKFIEVELKSEAILMYVDDEYNDYNPDNSLMTLFLVLRSIEFREESKDFLDWCRLFNLPTNSEPLRRFSMSFYDLKELLLKYLDDLDPCLPLFDYELGAGATEKQGPIGINV